MAKNPYRIWSDFVEQRQKEGQHEATKEVLIREYLMNGYGPEKAEKWVKLYTEKFAVSSGSGRIRLW